MCRQTRVSSKCLDLQNLFYSGKDCASAIWGWSILAHAWYTVTFSFSNPVHIFALCFTIVATAGFPANFFTVYKQWNCSPQMALVYQLISFFSTLFLMVVPGWCLWQWWDWTDVLSRYVAMVTIIDTVQELPVYAIAIIKIKRGCYVWPPNAVVYPSLSAAFKAMLSDNIQAIKAMLCCACGRECKISYTWLDLENAFLAGKDSQHGAFGLCEFAYACVQGGYTGSMAQIVGTVVAFLSLPIGTLFNGWCALSGANDDVSKGFATLHHLYSAILSWVVSMIAITSVSHDGYPLSDALVFYTYISAFDIVLNANWLIMVFVLIRTGKIVWPEADVYN